MFRSTSPIVDSHTTSLGAVACSQGATKEDDSSTVMIAIDPKFDRVRITSTETAMESSGGSGNVGSSTTPLRALLARSTSGLLAMLTKRAGACEGSTGYNKRYKYRYIYHADSDETSIEKKSMQF